MSQIQDDPRDVLAILNSLGFVGITAQQLKAFMKDLKLYRKIKERERQEWKEETKRKIMSKQEQMLKEMLRDTLASQHAQSLESTRSTESSVYNESSKVRIRVRVSEDGSNRNDDDVPRNKSESARSKPETVTKIIRPCRLTDDSMEPVERIYVRPRRERSKSYERSKPAEVSTDSSQCIRTERRQTSPWKEAQRPNQRDRDICAVTRPLSAPELGIREEVPKERTKSVASDPTGLKSARNPSRCSACSQTKSFIRPWRLQPEAQRAAAARKSDPVALYQKYRQEWKQISFPGEEQHARVRWAIREKMLGTDPNPRPILKNSQSLQSIKKR